MSIKEDIKSELDTNLARVEKLLSFASVIVYEEESSGRLKGMVTWVSDKPADEKVARKIIELTEAIGEISSPNIK